MNFPDNILTIEAGAPLIEMAVSHTAEGTLPESSPVTGMGSADPAAGGQSVQLPLESSPGPCAHGESQDSAWPLWVLREG